MLGGWTWGLQQQLQPRPRGNVALHSCLQGSARHTPFCCSNNRISAVGALSLGLGLRVNQTLRILAVSASLMGEAPAQTHLYLPTQHPPCHISARCLRAHGGGGTRLPPATSSSTHPSLAWPTDSFGLPPGPPGFPSPPPGPAPIPGLQIVNIALPTLIPSASVLAREGAGCGSVGDVPGAKRAPRAAFPSEHDQAASACDEMLPRPRELAQGSFCLTPRGHCDPRAASGAVGRRQPTFRDHFCSMM